MGENRLYRWFKKHQQKRRQKRFEMDLAKCINRMINDVMSLEDLDLVYDVERRESMKRLRRALLELQKTFHHFGLGLREALTEIEALSRAEEEEQKRADMEKEDGREDV